MEITQYLNELVAMIPAILQYVVPGLLMLWIYNRLLDKQLPQHYLVYSVVISFLLMQVVPTKKLQYIVACVLGAVLSVLRRNVKIKQVLHKLFKWSPSDSVWEDIIDYKRGTNMVVYTGCENDFSGSYVGMDNKKNVLLLSGYDVLDKEGNVLTTMDDRIVMIPRGEIKYIELCYALEAASKAQDTADGKRRVFTADASKDEHPDPPYDEGDLWYTGAEVLVCGKPKAKGEAYDAGDWGKKDNYTNKDEVVDAVDKKLTQEDIFNRLTNNGASQGMFIEDGNVYFNATYIKSGEINSDLIKTGKISSKDGSVYFDLDNSVVHTTDGQFVTTLDKNSILIKSGDNTLARLNGYNETYGTENVVQIADAMLKLDTYQYDDTEKTTTHTNTMVLDGSSITFRAGEVTSSSSMSSLSKAGLSTERITFNNAIGTLTAQKESDTSGRFVIDFSTTQLRGNVQLYGNGNSMYIYDGTTNWGGQTLGWDGSKEVTTLDANTQAVPFIYGIELVKNAQGYVTDVKLKQHGLRFIGGILV